MIDYIKEIRSMRKYRTINAIAGFLQGYRCLWSGIIHPNEPLTQGWVIFV